MAFWWIWRTVNGCNYIMNYHREHHTICHSSGKMRARCCWYFCAVTCNASRNPWRKDIVRASWCMNFKWIFCLARARNGVYTWKESLYWEKWAQKSYFSFEEDSTKSYQAILCRKYISKDLRYFDISRSRCSFECCLQSDRSCRSDFFEFFMWCFDLCCWCSSP